MTAKRRVIRHGESVRMADREHGAGSKEQGAKSQEQRAKSKEPGAESMETLNGRGKS